MEWALRDSTIGDWSEDKLDLILPIPHHQFLIPNPTPKSTLLENN
jgi:hypothetical protein